jgi:hypothetical protein
MVDCLKGVGKVKVFFDVEMGANISFLTAKQTSNSIKSDKNQIFSF